MNKNAQSRFFKKENYLLGGPSVLYSGLSISSQHSFINHGLIYCLLIFVCFLNLQLNCLGV